MSDVLFMPACVLRLCLSMVGILGSCSTCWLNINYPLPFLTMEIIQPGDGSKSRSVCTLGSEVKKSSVKFVVQHKLCNTMSLLAKDEHKIRELTDIMTSFDMVKKILH
ncbi:hypothetical protein C0989_002187 [Termitomyces sp. Mn162]|nr:hypothetical protein C0989_002187 [Termitomyces sp. Mn162]